jgi:hypothetical protein
VCSLTFHIRPITGDGEVNPEVWVSTQAFANSKDARLLLASIREKNVGNVTASFDPNALALTVKKVPCSITSSYV